MKKNKPPFEWYKNQDLGPDKIQKFAELIAPMSYWLPEKMCNFQYGVQNRYLASILRIGLLKNESCFNYYCIVAFAAAIIDNNPGIVDQEAFFKNIQKMIEACVDIKEVSDLDGLTKKVITQASLIKPVSNL